MAHLGNRIVFQARLCSVQVFKHSDGEVWSLAASTKDPSIIISSYNTIRESDGNFCMKSTLWKLPFEQEANVDRLCDLDVSDHGTDIKVNIALRSANFRRMTYCKSSTFYTFS